MHAAVRLAAVSLLVAGFVACGAVEAVAPAAAERRDAAAPLDAAPRDALVDSDLPDRGAPDGGPRCEDLPLQGAWTWTPAPPGPALSFPLTLREGEGPGTDLWTSIDDWQFVIDEGILAFSLPKPLRPGRYRCVPPEAFDPAGDGVVVVVAEHRGFEYSLAPEGCAVEVHPPCEGGAARFAFDVAGGYVSDAYGPIAVTVHLGP